MFSHGNPYTLAGSTRAARIGHGVPAACCHGSLRRRALTRPVLGSPALPPGVLIPMTSQLAGRRAGQGQSRFACTLAAGPEEL